MTEYVATFWTHFSAMSTLRAFGLAGVRAEARPVPRALSASCGTCVRYWADDPRAALLHADYERVVTPVAGGYETVMKNDAAL